MNLTRCLFHTALMVSLLALPGCDSTTPPPTLEKLEGILSVSIPDGSKVIGGKESSDGLTLWLISSPEPLPLPWPDSRMRASQVSTWAATSDVNERRRRGRA